MQIGMSETAPKKEYLRLKKCEEADQDLLNQ